jgi:N-acylneuraminate cytidylyltransferase
MFKSLIWVFHDNQTMTGVTALVPMKGHSERVPDKNMRQFNGRPLCHWILNTLSYVPEVEEIIVNTDSERIAESIGHFDVTVFQRPESLRGDHVSMNRIILHDVSETEADLYLQTHCTNPLLRPETISDAIKRFRDEDCDSLFSVTSIQTRLWDETGVPINHKRDELKRTQDLTPVYEENSNIYLFSAESVTLHKNRIGSNPEMFPMDETEAIDIDEVIDFKVAETLHRKRYGDEPDLTDIVD